MKKKISLIGAGQIGGTLAHLISIKELGDVGPIQGGGTADDLMNELGLDDVDVDMTDEQLEAMLTKMAGGDLKEKARELIGKRDQAQIELQAHAKSGDKNLALQLEEKGYDWI